MSQRGLFRLVHLPPDLAMQLKDSVEEAFQSLGGATAELILHYERRRHHVDMNKLPDGIEEVDKAQGEILGSGIFFFQAEDGIRDVAVTGVQTCALPICARGSARLARQPALRRDRTAWDRPLPD